MFSISSPSGRRILCWRARQRLSTSAGVEPPASGMRTSIANTLVLRLPCIRCQQKQKQTVATACSLRQIVMHRARTTAGQRCRANAAECRRCRRVKPPLFRRTCKSTSTICPTTDAGLQSKRAQQSTAKHTASSPIGYDAQFQHSVCLSILSVGWSL